jgi:hypothetical protein
MTLRALVLLAVSVALPAQADQGERVLSAVLSGDWNGDEAPDAALLYAHEDGMTDLVILQGSGYRGLQPLLDLPGVIWSGPMAGQMPGFEARSDTSFAIRSEQTGVGRTPWYQWVTVAWRDGAYVVAGYDYSFYDRLDLSHHGNCSVNLLAGRYTLDHGPGDEAAEIHREGRTDDVAFPLADLREGWQARACDDLFR